MTINPSLKIIRYHHNFIQVIGTNFIVHNTHLVGTSTELNLITGYQFCSTFFAAYSNQWFMVLLGWGMLADGIEPPAASV